MRVAAIDLGSNTLRILIAEADGKKLDVISEFIRSPRTGLDVKETKLISPQSMLRVLELLRRCRLSWKELSVEKVVAVATHFSREAKNWNVLSQSIMREVGVDIKSISEQEEAELGFLGTTYDVDKPGNLTVIDIGGGSTEFIFNELKLNTSSMPFGSLNLTEGFIKNDPPTKNEIKKIRKVIKQNLASLKPKVTHSSRIGIGGTFASLALLAQNQKAYDVEKINNYELKKDDISAIFEKLVSVNKFDREELLPWDRTRAEILPTGALICEGIMDYFKWESITTRHRGIVHGLAIRAAKA